MSEGERSPLGSQAVHEDATTPNLRKGLCVPCAPRRAPPALLSLRRRRPPALPARGALLTVWHCRPHALPPRLPAAPPPRRPAAPPPRRARVPRAGRRRTPRMRATARFPSPRSSRSRSASTAPTRMAAGAWICRSSWTRLGPSSTRTARRAVCAPRAPRSPRACLLCSRHARAPCPAHAAGVVAPDSGGRPVSR